MSKNDLGRKSIRYKLMRLILVVLIIASVTVGLISYFISRNALDEKGRIILKNSVEQAISMIEIEQSKVESGLTTLEVSQEYIKSILQGPMNEDGTRDLHHNIDLGEQGYFIVYSPEGIELMHPTLEGQNVWDVQDMSDDQHLLVQEQINVALKGGGYVDYSWNYPHSNTVGKKMSYAKYEAGWDWVVVSTAYNLDFNRDSRVILYIIIGTIVLVYLLLVLVLFGFIKRMTRPIMNIVEGLAAVGIGQYQRIDDDHVTGEAEILLTGYNSMIESLLEAEQTLKRKNDQLEYLAYYDELTGLPNRYGLERFLESRIDKNSGIGYLIQADIAGLKMINSTMGFEQGDQLLKLIGQYFTRLMDKNFMIARSSSNEFSLWFENEQLETVKQKLRDLRRDIKIYLENLGYGQRIEFHTSMAICDKDCLDFNKLYEMATTAMKVAKEKQDFKLQVYQESMKETIENELSMRKHLHDALINREIVPYYQAKIDYRDQSCVGVEALARWQSEQLGFVSPGVFIPALSQLNLMKEFTTYMIDRVFSDYERLKIKYRNEVSISINISPEVFTDVEFTGSIARALKAFKVPPDRLILEITEDVLIGDYTYVSNIIDELHGLGVRISIDDFGTGYSSLNYLAKISFDELKIDKSFIDQMEEDDKAYRLFKILCKIADIYGYELVAEGVETTHQLDLIKETSLNIIQGYLFSKPESLD